MRAIKDGTTLKVTELMQNYDKRVEKREIKFFANVLYNDFWHEIKIDAKFITSTIAI